MLDKTQQQLLDFINSEEPVFSEKHKIARSLAQAGTPIFPCCPETKKPATENGFHDATTDVAQIDAWWTEEPEYNPAYCPNDIGQSVVDVDGLEGPVSWEKLKNEVRVPDTREVTTPSGGKHYHFLGELPPSVWKPDGKRNLGSHIDTRGVGSYVLAPGAFVKDKKTPQGGYYTVTADREIAPVPAEFQERLKVRTEAIDESETVVELDLPNNVERARAHLVGLVKEGRVAIAGQAGDDTTLELGYVLRDFAISEAKATELALKHWYPHCTPNNEPDFVETKFHNSYRYPQNKALGVNGVEPASVKWSGADFGPDARDDRDEIEKPAAPFLEDIATMLARPDPEPLVEGFLMQGENACIASLPKCGKTFVALDTALSIAAGLQVFGNLTVRKRGPVIYLSGEGHAGMKRRIKAWCQHRGLRFGPGSHGETVFTADGTELPFFYKAAVPMTREGGTECTRFIDGIKGYLRGKGLGDPVLIVIDTMARSMAGLKENENGDMNSYLDMTEGLRGAFGQGCATLTLAHTRKDKDKAPSIRGGGAADAGFDAIWNMRKEAGSAFATLEEYLFKDSHDLGSFFFKITSGLEGITGAVLIKASPADYKKKAQDHGAATKKAAENSLVYDALASFSAYGIASAVHEAKTIAERIVGPEPKPASRNEYLEWAAKVEAWKTKLDNGSRERNGTPGRFACFCSVDTPRKWYLPETSRPKAE